MIVKTISENNGTALIEWMEDSQPQRALVPSREVSAGGECLHPERGLPYGVDFAELITITVTPADIDRELKNNGIWTADDLLHKPKLVQGAIAAAYGIVLGDLLRNVRRLTTG
jgi:hypothetical protein